MTFPNRDQLRKHIKRKHEKVIACQTCLDKFDKNLDDGVIDVNEHTSLVQSVNFKKKTQLRKHLQEEHDQGWFICEHHCGKRFKQEKTYQAHMSRVEQMETLKRLKVYEFQSSDFRPPFGSIASEDEDKSNS